ncbi:MAG: ATP-binding protein [Chloroflexota bacterium]|nr:ATP-binding protein [Chloroflexota bacterium]
MLDFVVPSSEEPAPRATWQRYGVAGAAVAVAMGLAALLVDPHEQSAFLLFLAAVAVSAWYGGVGPALLATALGAALADYLFEDPQFTLSITSPLDLLRLLVFGGTALFITLITEARSRADARSREQAARLQTTLTSIADGVIVTDTLGQIVFMNSVAEGMTGWALIEARGRSLSAVVQLVDATTRRPVESVVGVVLRGEPLPTQAPLLLVARDGSTCPVDERAAPMRDAHGRILGVVLVGRDVTERQAAEAERAALLGREQASRQAAEAGAAQYRALAEANARLATDAQRALAVRDQFLSIASHELKTPLTGVLGSAQLLQRRLARSDTLSEANARTLRIMLDQGMRLNRMISSLLDVSRIETGQLSIEPAPLDLSALLRRIVDEVQPTLDTHTLTVTTPAAPLWINGDALRLEQVFQNLIGNAVKYSPAGGPITMQVAAQGPDACVQVQDMGIGIPAAALPHLFQRFYRAANTAQEGISGIGVGLFVVREIVTLHGGRVEVSSSEGAGSVFTVYLPQHSAPLTA